MSRKFCGEGFPDFAVNETNNVSFPGFPLPLLNVSIPIDNQTGYPMLSECLKYDWGLYYYSYPSTSAWQNFYSNAGNIWEAFGDFWTLLAKTFASNPAVLGYEILNEPVLSLFRY